MHCGKLVITYYKNHDEHSSNITTYMSTKKTTSFLPEGYNVPASGGNFMKFKDGENRFRILTPVVLGWQGWKDGKPFNREGAEQNIDVDEVDVDEKYGTGKPKIAHFWAFVVYDYQEEKIAILQITQKTIMKVIKELSEDEDWGDPREYDLTVTQKKEGNFIKYSVKPSPQKALKPSIEEAFEESDIDLDEILFAERDEDEEDEDWRRDEDRKKDPKGKKKSSKDF